MKKLIKFSVIKSLAAILLFSPMSWAATSGTLLLSGIVGVVYSISITPNAAATTLDIVGGETDTLVASVAEATNNPLGYNIDVSSANDGKLIHDTNPLEFVDYQISYDGGAAITPSTVAAMVKNNTGSGIYSSDVTVSFAGKADAQMGTFSDTLTFTISAP